MNKEELIHMHALMDEIRDYGDEHFDSSLDTARYDNSDADSSMIFKGMDYHKIGLMALGESIASSVDEEFDSFKWRDQLGRTEDPVHSNDSFDCYRDKMYVEFEDKEGNVVLRLGKLDQSKKPEFLYELAKSSKSENEDRKDFRTVYDGIYESSTSITGYREEFDYVLDGDFVKDELADDLEDAIENVFSQRFAVAR